jgi:two-component system, OmpR family, phosphate regulon sensor histidine kinase PhoR
VKNIIYVAVNFQKSHIWRHNIRVIALPRAPCTNLLKSIWWRSGATLITLALVSALVAALFSVKAAATFFAIWMGIAWLRDQRYLAALARWIDSAGAEPLPPASGPWDELFAKLYRQKRDFVREHDALADALASLRRAAQALPEGVVMLNSQNQILWCNDQAEDHFELRREGDSGQSISNLLRTPDFLSYLAKGQWDTALLLRVRSRNSREERVLSAQLVEYGDAQKLLLSRDVTKLERLETMRRDFVANVSHELKTPLTVLSGFLETIREIQPAAKQREEYLALMAEQAERMKTLVADLLALSALEASVAPPEERIDMGQLVARIKQEAETLSSMRHTVEFRVDPGLGLCGSESEIASALTNLVTNAIRYTPEGGRIEVSWQEDLRDDGLGAIFRVEDSGIGIPHQHLPRLTERFYRVDRGRSRGTGGTGLGLAIVKHVLTRHQASLDIKSTVGVGSVFAARFPPARVLRMPNEEGMAGTLNEQGVKEDRAAVLS